jgi:serine/threonine protein kinase
MQLIPGTVVGGKYELERALASGGMGSIWVARHTELNVKVAVKFISAAYSTSPTLRARFVREARAAAQIASSFVVHVHDYGVAEDTPYIVMELLEGEDLSVRLKREERLSLPDVTRICMQIAKGLRAAHKAGFVHRDLKPSNVFLVRTTEDDDEEAIKILDFGVAKQIEASPLDECTKTGEIMGSPHYMSPEQILESKSIDARSDLWSFAVILFRAITGELPFPGDACGLVMSKILTDPIPLPSRHAPELPASVDEFFMRAFQRDPAHRFQTARELAEAFAKALGVAPSRRLSWTFPDAATPTCIMAPGETPPSLAPLSSTLPAAFALEGTLRSVEQPPPTGLQVTALDRRVGEWRDVIDERLPTPPRSINEAPTAALQRVEARAPAKRRPLMAWTLGASCVLGAAMGWLLITSIVHPAGAEASPRQAEGASQAMVAPVAPTLALAASAARPTQPAAPDAPAGAAPEASGAPREETTLMSVAGQGVGVRSDAASASPSPSASHPASSPRGASKMARRPLRLGF